MKEGVEPLKVVLDTNVLLSALGFPGKEIGRLWALVEEGKILASVSSFILEELERNLLKKTGLTPEEVRVLIDEARSHLHLVEPVETVDLIKRKNSDNRILECALAAKAQVLITGDHRDIRPLGTFRGVDILTPREFMDRYFPSSKNTD